MNSRVSALAVSALIVVLDQWTKALVRQKLTLADTVTVIPGFFNLVHAENPGAAFSILAGASQTVRTVLLVGLASVIIVLLAAGLFGKFHIVSSAMSRWAVALVLGGAIGNLIDRVRVGTVTDFLEFYLGSYYWPSFNVADSAIFCGAVLLFAEQWLYKQPKEQNVS